MKTKSQEMMAYQAVAAPAELAARTNQWAACGDLRRRNQFSRKP